MVILNHHQPQWQFYSQKAAAKLLVTINNQPIMPKRHYLLNYNHWSHHHTATPLQCIMYIKSNTNFLWHKVMGPRTHTDIHQHWSANLIQLYHITTEPHINSTHISGKRNAICHTFIPFRWYGTARQSLDKPFKKKYKGRFIVSHQQNEIKVRRIPLLFQENYLTTVPRFAIQQKKYEHIPSKFIIFFFGFNT